MSLLWSGGELPEVVTGKRMLVIVGVVLLFAFGVCWWVSKALNLYR